MRRVILGAVSSVLLVAVVIVVAVGPVSVQAQATGTPEGNVLFEDDFATYSSRWQEKNTPKASAIYQEGALRIEVRSPGVYAWSVPDFNTLLADYRVEVAATFEGGSLDSWLGIMIDYVDDAHFYALMVGIDGRWRWLFHQETEWIDLTPDDAEPVAWMAQVSSFRLHVEVMGDRVALWIDDEPAGEVEIDRKSARGIFGLIVRAGHGYADVRFDDMLVTLLDGESAHE